MALQLQILNTQQLSINVTNKLAFSLLECFLSIQKLYRPFVYLVKTFFTSFDVILKIK